MSLPGQLQAAMTSLGRQLGGDFVLIRRELVELGPGESEWRSLGEVSGLRVRLGTAVRELREGVWVETDRTRAKVSPEGLENISPRKGHRLRSPAGRLWEIAARPKRHAPDDTTLIGYTLELTEVAA